jgi:tellurite resistance protein TehA-like permease
MANSYFKTLPPTWAVAAMSLSGFTVISLFDPLPNTEIDLYVGFAALASAIAFQLWLTPALSLKYLTNKGSFKTDIDNPGTGAQVAAWPASVLILALAIAQFGNLRLVDATVATWSAAILAALGLLGTLTTGFVFFTGIVSKTVAPMAITANWFVPVVPMVLVPSILIRLSEMSDFFTPANFSWIAAFAWGSGAGLFLLLASTIAARLLTAEAPEPHQLASWWAWLAPLGAGGLGLLSVTKMLGLTEMIVVARWFDAVIWGFSLWWALFALGVVWRMRKVAKFHLGFWGFGFPTAAFGTLSLETGRALEIPAMQVAGAVAWVALAVLVVWLSIKSARRS